MEHRPGLEESAETDLANNASEQRPISGLPVGGSD